jgi:cell wall-associated NlpC family hydrolase
MNDGERIVAAARGWLGTRFHHQGRLKKTPTHAGGVDCLGLLVGLAKELELCGRNGQKLAALDKVDYSHQPDVQRLRFALSAALCEVDKGEMQLGDVALMQIDGRAQHLAIISQLADDARIIHAYAPARAVVEHGLDALWLARIEALFRC